MPHQLGIRLVFGASFVLTSCHAGPAKDNNGMADQSRYNCDRRAVEITAIPEDSFPEAERCRLLGIATTSIGQATSSTGVLPGDTAAIREVLIMSLSQTDPEGEIVTSKWHISLRLEGRPYDAEVIIDRLTGSTVLSRIHKPL
jgi:hypothetical protein